MLTIVTGPVGAGKTARMRELSIKAPAADGFLSEKIFRDGAFGGYRLVRLRGGEGMDLALPVSAFRGQFREACRLGPFVFSAEAFRYGTETLARLCADSAVSAVFLDEAGPLELRGEGFAAALHPLLQSGKELFITVRSPCLPAFLRTFGVGEYLCLTPSDAIGNSYALTRRFFFDPQFTMVGFFAGSTRLKPPWFIGLP